MPPSTAAKGRHKKSRSSSLPFYLMLASSQKSVSPVNIIVRLQAYIVTCYEPLLERPMLYTVDLSGITYLVETNNKEKDANEALVSFVLLAQITTQSARFDMLTIFAPEAIRGRLPIQFGLLLPNKESIKKIYQCETLFLNSAPLQPDEILRPNEILNSFDTLVKWLLQLGAGPRGICKITVNIEPFPRHPIPYPVIVVLAKKGFWDALEKNPFIIGARTSEQFENLVTSQISALKKYPQSGLSVSVHQPPARRQLFPTSDAQVSNASGSTLAVVNVQPPPDKTSHYSERTPTKPISKSNTPKNTEETQPQESRLLRTAVQTQERLTGVQAKIITVQAGVILKLSQDLDAHEERLMAVERELIAQNELVVDQGNQIASLRRTVEQQQSQLETLMGANALIMFSSHHEPETDPNNNNHYSVDPKKRKATDQEGEEGTHSKTSFDMCPGQ